MRQICHHDDCFTCPYPDCIKSEYRIMLEDRCPDPVERERRYAKKKKQMAEAKRRVRAK